MSQEDFSPKQSCQKYCFFFQCFLKHNAEVILQNFGSMKTYMMLQICIRLRYGTKNYHRHTISKFGTENIELFLLCYNTNKCNFYYTFNLSTSQMDINATGQVQGNVPFLSHK